MTEEKKHPRIIVVEIRGINQQSWIDGYFRDGWIPHYPATTVFDPNAQIMRNFLTLTHPDQG